MSVHPHIQVSRRRAPVRRPGTKYRQSLLTGLSFVVLGVIAYIALLYQPSPETFATQAATADQRKLVVVAPIDETVPPNP